MVSGRSVIGIKSAIFLNRQSTNNQTPRGGKNLKKKFSMNLFCKKYCLKSFPTDLNLYHFLKTDLDIN